MSAGYLATFVGLGQARADPAFRSSDLAGLNTGPLPDFTDFSLTTYIRPQLVACIIPLNSLDSTTYLQLVRLVLKSMPYLHRDTCLCEIASRFKQCARWEDFPGVSAAFSSL